MSFDLNAKQFQSLSDSSIPPEKELLTFASKTNLGDSSTQSVLSGYVYLDWAATAPLCKEALQAMIPFMQADGASFAYNMNANSLHSPGRRAFEALELARKQIACDLGAKRPSEIIFTSGATEANNAALFGIAHAALQKHPRRNDPQFRPRIITSTIEHDAILKPALKLKRQGFELVCIKPNKQGFIEESAFRKALNDDTILVSIQLVNSEIGAVQDLSCFVSLAHEQGAYFHTDATQALGKVPLDLQDLDVDAASFSAHKIAGPKGIGALYLKSRTPYDAYLLGGGQEEGKRSTTQNVCGIAGFAAALRKAQETQKQEALRECILRDMLYRKLVELPGVCATVMPEPNDMHYAPHIISVMVKGFESETLILQLDRLGFGVSGGSACSSHSLEPSHVLSALGYASDEAYGALRVSLGYMVSEENLSAFVAALKTCIS